MMSPLALLAPVPTHPNGGISTTSTLTRLPAMTPSPLPLSRGVACSYESLPCVHLLRLLAPDIDDADAQVFRPTLIDSEVDRFLRATGIGPDDAMTSTDGLGGYLNTALVNSPECPSDISVLAYFGAQAAVQRQLTTDQWWPPALSKVLAPAHEGVYALWADDEPSSTSLTSGGVRIVLFAWLSDTSLGASHMRERAAFALRFLTTLTSDVVYCSDPTAADSLPTTIDDMAESAPDDKKYSTSYSIHATQVEEEHVRCKALDMSVLAMPSGVDTVWPSCGGGNSVCMSMVKVDKRVYTTRGSLTFHESHGFASWVSEMVATHAIDVHCQLPTAWMASMLKLHAMLPRLDTEAAIEDALWADAAAQTTIDMATFQDRCRRQGAVVFYVERQGGAAAEVAATKALAKELALLRGWLSELGDAPPSTELMEYRVRVEKWINDAYAARMQAERTWRSFLDGWTVTPKTLAFPILNHLDVGVVLAELQPRLQAAYDHWCARLDDTLGPLHAILTAKTHAKMLKRASVHARLQRSHDDAIREAFDAFVTACNAAHDNSALRVTLTSQFGRRGCLGYTQQAYHDQAQLVTVMEVCPTNNRASRTSHATLPPDATLLLVAVKADITVVVFTEPHPHATHVHVIKHGRVHLARVFPKAARLCAFEPSKRLVAMLHSETKIDVYGLSESFKVLECVHSVDLAILVRLVPPYRDLVFFGGENHGLTVVDSLGHVQSYFVRSKQLSPEAMVVVDNTKVVPVRGGALLLFLTREDEGADDATTSYRVRVQAMSTADNAMLPPTELDVCGPIQAWRRLCFACSGDATTLVGLDPTSSRFQMWTLDIATSKTMWHLTRSQTCPSRDDPVKAHPLWTFFHLYEKFPVQSLASSSSSALVPCGPLHVHVVGGGELAHQVKTILQTVMTKLHSLQKRLTPLDLAAHVVGHEGPSMPWAGTTLSTAKWVLELVTGTVPVQICCARDNQLVLLESPSPPDMAPTTTTTDAHDVAASIWLGYISSVLRHWTRSVVVVSSMGKQSTGKSYFLNHLTGTSFAMSGARCTDGVWLSVRLWGADCLLVVLDFEGVGSFERSAQEDTFLSVLNAAVSRLTIFRVNMRVDKDMDAMFAKFQQGQALLRGDPRLFQGHLCLSAKDVNPHDQEAVVAEFQTKLEALLADNRSNFVTTMYGSHVDVTCCPPLGNAGYYDALDDARALLESAHVSAAYSSGAAFHDCLTTVLSKMSVLDWTNMEESVKERHAMELRRCIRTMLATGAMPNGPLNAPTDVDLYKDKWRATGVGLALDQVTLLESWLQLKDDWASNATAALVDAKRLRVACLARVMEWTSATRRDASVDTQFDLVWGFMLWRRGHIVHQYVANLPSAISRPELDDLEACVAYFGQLVRRCQHTCAHCKLGCMESLAHDPLGTAHDCGTDHQCASRCTHCLASLGEDEPVLTVLHCSMAAGHGGNCNCGRKKHTCGGVCAQRGAVNCDAVCSLAIDHAGAHACGVALHMCGQPCAAPHCRNSCTLPFANPHEVHTCGFGRCQQPCGMAACSQTCAAPDHFHDPGLAMHLCDQSHRCVAECTADGMCEIKVHLKHVADTFTGQRSTFGFSRQEMNGAKRACALVVPPAATTHAADGHRCDRAVHYCDARCPCCRYVCDKPFGHTDLHRTPHGNMTETYFVSDGQTVDVAERRYAVGERGVAEMCPFFCSTMGRGHVHFMPCEQPTAETCVYAAADGRTHCRLRLEPHPDQPMDQLLHDAYWTALGWEDPVTSAAEKATFKLCPYRCDASDHAVDAPSYCVLDAWHAPVNTSSVSHSVVHGHEFACTHVAARGQSHHIFVLDSSGSMAGAYWRSLTTAVRAYLTDQMAKRSIGGDIVSVVTFSDDGAVVFEGESMATMADAEIPFRGGGTDYDAGLRCAIEVLSRNDTHAPILLFFSDGYPKATDSGVHLADHIVTNFDNLLSFVVGFGNMDFVCLEQLAVRLRGGFHQAISSVDLLETFKSISVSVHLNAGLVAHTA
ncbi:Aste57867_19425 [Aphanomyces stellatus]|uniref:Aste57867_19425 protein n=1 Tax=Aphanomyces stellatus TaxID=120398 RepID=A0A485LDX3_9STRA|nr:hypothetical protein As57867_019361 [Aphanomyces stellatus]VFT96139.1 Aste57867_19425 [Aphanomyces stellatus]